MLTAHGTITIRPKEVVPIYREEWSSTVTDYKYNLVNRDFVSRNGILYSVKAQEPGQFVPVGIDPDSEVGVEYWLPFNNLAPTATNFLVVTDDKGMPQTLMSGGRIQTKFLNIGSLNMSETRLWGGAELFTGKGLALVNDPGDRKFVVYNDADNYVEMFQRETEWGLKGVKDGVSLFHLGGKSDGTGLWDNVSKIGPFSINANNLISSSPYIVNGYTYAKELKLTNEGIVFTRAEGTTHEKYVYLGSGAGTKYSGSLFAIQNGDMYQQGVVRENNERACRFYTGDLYLRGVSTHRQLISDNWRPVMYPMLSGETYVGDVGTDTTFTVDFPDLGLSDYIVIGSFRVNSDSDKPEHNNGITWVVYLQRSSYFKVSTWDRSRNTNNLVFSWAIFPNY